MKHGLCVKTSIKKEKKPAVNHILLCTADGKVIKKFPKLFTAVCEIKQGTKYGRIYYQLSSKGFYWLDDKRKQKLIREFPPEEVRA